MSVYDELCDTGVVTPEFVALVRKLAHAVARRRNFPPLDPHKTWDGPALDDFVQDFFAARPIDERLSVILAAVPNEAAFISGLETAIAHQIQSALRDTPQGSVAVTVFGVIDDEPRFDRKNRFVGLVDWPADRQPAQCPDTVLHRAVADVEIVVPAWNPESTHRPPFADRQSIVRLVDAILAAAGGPVEANTVLDVIIARCDIPELTREVPTGDYSVVPSQPAEASEYAAARAREVWAEMSPQQRRALGTLGDSVRDAAAHIGVGKTRASEVLGEARAGLAPLLGDDPDARDVARELLRLAAEPDG